MLAPIIELGRMIDFLWLAIKSLRVSPLKISEIVSITNDILWRCLFPVVSVVSAFGMVVALQGANVFRMLGTDHMVASLLSLSLIRELSPCITAIMIAAQAGSSIAAEIGAMRINQEIDALEVMAVHPMSLLVIPRILGTIFSGIVVNIFAISGGIFFGGLVSVYIKGVSLGSFMEYVFAFTIPLDLISTTFKIICFGFIIGLMSCYYGYYTERGAEGVGISANNAVVRSIIVFIFVNYILTTLFFEVGKLIGAYS